MLRRGTAIISAVAMLTLWAVAIVPAATADTCWDKGFKTARDRVGRLGGPNRFAGPVSSPAELAELLRAEPGLWDELAEIMNAKGQGAAVPALRAAIDAGRADVVPIPEGEVYQWMAWRKRGEARASDPVCMVVPTGRYEQYIYNVEVESEVTPEPVPDFDLRVTEKDGVVKVTVAGNRNGVSVKGPDGPITLDSSGSWSKDMGTSEEARTMKFAASRPRMGKKQVVAHTFSVPPKCVNLSYVGAAPARMVEESLSPTEKASSVTIPPVIPPKVSCDISVNPSTVQRRGTVEASVSGDYDNVEVKLFAPDGSEVTSFTGPSSGPIKLKQVGTYTFKGEATKGYDSAMCKATVVVEAPDGCHDHGSGNWVLRGFGTYIGTDGDGTFTSTFRPDGVNERSELDVLDGTGLGLSLERLFGNCRVGLEGGLLAADLDTRFMFDLDAAWAHDEDDLGLLAFTLGPNFHLTPNSPVDFYIGPFIGLVQLDDLSYNVLGETQNRDLDDEFVFGIQLGLDIPFGGSAWGLHLGSHYFDLSTDIGTDEVDLNPLTADVGLSFRF